MEFETPENGSANGGTAAKDSAAVKEEAAAGASKLFKLLTFIFIAVGMLFATDALEIKSSMQDGEFKTGLVLKRFSNNSTTLRAKKKLADAGEASSARVLYKRRGQPLTDDEHEDMVQKYGTWDWDDEPDRHTLDNVYAKYPNRDVPYKKFPSNAWQKQKTYVSRFLQEGQDLVMRSMEAILAEYGHGVEHEPGVPFVNRSAMFTLRTYDEDYIRSTMLDQKKSAGEDGGWTTEKSWAGLQRRLLHAVMTEDSFIFAMGGHSSAAGHGNHFEQTYTSQVHLILEPVFARLGVRHESRNLANGGMGTIQHGLGGGSFYGPDVSFLMWDSGMTEGGNKRDQDMYARQALLGGRKVPFIYNLESPVLQLLHNEADVDVGLQGSHSLGIPNAETMEDLEKIAWAPRYMRCGNEIKKEVCKPHDYSGVCWIERPDGFTPPTSQNAEPGGRASWHPGDKVHRLTGRGVTFMILRALHESLVMWSAADGQVLPDSAWHVTEYYETMKQKIRDSDADITGCGQYKDLGMPFFCNLPVKVRSEWTPRAYAPHSNIRSLMAPDMLENINTPEDNLYDPPDMFNALLHPPKGEVDVLSIIESGPTFKTIFKNSHVDFYEKPSVEVSSSLPPGKGFKLTTKAGDDNCDGVIGSFCDRGANNKCMLYGHMDGRNGILFDSLSGWMKLIVPKLKYGYIVIKIESWHSANENTRTEGWETVNNETRRLRHDTSNARIVNASANAMDQGRNLKALPPEYCDDFQFEVAIDGKVTTYNLEQHKEKLSQLQRVVQIVTLLADPDYTGGEEKDVEVAFRMLNCGRVKVYQLSHIYWA